MKKYKKQLPSLFVVLAIVSSVLLNLASMNRPAYGDLVVEVTDGDTFFIENKQPVRIYGIDAPDIEHCYGEEARQRLEELILGKHVDIREPRADSFRRVMGLIYIDNEFINEAMVREGMAFYEGYSGSMGEVMSEARDYAKEQKNGIYSSACSQLVNPEDPECNIKGNFATKSKQKLYSYPGCSQYDQTIVELYKGEKWFCTEQEAIAAGFIKSQSCW